MMLTTIIGAMTLAALGPNTAIHHGSNAQIHAPEIIEIRAGMINTGATNRSQVRFSGNTQPKVVAVSNADGSIGWESSDREKMGGQNAPALIYVQIFDGVFAIDPFQPLPAATASTAQMLFRGTTLETDRTQHGRRAIDRTKELFAKLEQARNSWLHNNGFYGVRVFTNDQDTNGQEQAKAESRGLPQPSAVFERPADIPRIKSREQVNANDQAQMSGVVAMMNNGGSVRISLPHTVPADIQARAEKHNQAQLKADQVAIDR